MRGGVPALVLVAASAAAGAAEPRFAEQTIAGETREAGEAKWSYELYRAATLTCPKSKPGDCVRNLIHVRNHSARAIQCHLVMEQPRKDDSGKKRIEYDMVMYAGREGKLSMSYGPVALVPRRFDVTCAVVPHTPEAIPTPKECWGQLSVPSPRDFYPPGANRRQEEGDVVLEYGVERREPELKDVLVVGSSGFEALDNAALALSKEVRSRGQCPDRRYRMKIKFQMPEPGWPAS
jgi:TonB family protein